MNLSTPRDPSRSALRLKLTRSDWILLALFLLTLPLVNPWIRGDGVGYYAMARAPLVQHNLDFRPDWYSANPSFRLNKIDANNELYPGEYTRHGHVTITSRSDPLSFGRRFCFPSTLRLNSPATFGSQISDDGFRRSLSSLPSRSPPRFTVFSALWLSYPTRAPSTSRITGPSLPPLRSGSRVRFPSTCTSIPPGPMRTPLSPSRFSFGIGIALAPTALGRQWLLLGLLGALC